ncbi:MAG TPA: EAL domain-containing protein [Desulfosporosinus sp.]|nr:EAL domain-containing protein [Desulfosporosinus sp.]
MDEFRASEVQLQALAHALAEGLLLFDLEGVLQYLNPEAGRLLDWNMAEALGIRTYRDLHDPSQTHEEMCFIECALVSQIVVRADGEKIFRQDGSAFYAMAVASPVVESGHVVGCAVAFRDMSESFQLSEDRRQLRLQNTALNATTHAIVKMDNEGRILWANPAFTQLTGYSLENVLGQTPRFLRSGYQDQGFYERMWKTILDGQIWQGELINRRMDGTLYSEEMTITPVKEESHKITHFIAVKQDISERLTNQRALRNSEEQFRDMFQTMSNAVAVFEISSDRQDFICTDINRAAEQIENISREEAIGSSITKVFPLVKELGLFVLCQQVFRTGKRAEFPAVYYKNQRAVGWSEGLIYKLTTGNIVVLYEDVTQRVLNERALWQEKERAQVTLASIGDAVLTTDVQGRVTYLNPVAEMMIGWTNEEAQGLMIERVFDIYHESTGLALAQPAQQCLLEQRIIALANHAVLRNRDGKQLFHIEDSAAPIFDREGKVIGAVLVFHDVSEKRDLLRRMSYQANHDALTDLPNRQLFIDRVHQAILQASRHKEQVAVFFLDLDGFKLVNDTLGHAAGDTLLRQVGERFKTSLRQEDTVARHGGDEFLILLPYLPSEQQAAKVAQKILDTLSAPFQLAKQEVYISASLGIALYPLDGEDPEILIQHADMAMYQVKAKGRNHYHFYTIALHERLSERLALQNEMRRAIERHEFVLYYQPQFCLSDGQFCGMEALVRWQHPERGFLLPDKFISIAENSGLILPLGKWVLRTACAQNKLWQDMGYPPVRVAVNLSARQFQQKDLVRQVAEILEETGLEPEWLELEITESLSMENVVVSVEILQKLKSMGVHLAIDDFGTGFSSLSYLNRFSLNTLKIDRSFITGVDVHSDRQAIVLTIIQLAQNLGLKVIAEGVETQGELDFLRIKGCDEVQGFLLAKPVSIEKLVSYFAENRTYCK